MRKEQRRVRLTPESTVNIIATLKLINDHTYMGETEAQGGAMLNLRLMRGPEGYVPRARESISMFMKDYYHDKEITDFVTGSPSLRADTALPSQCVPVRGGRQGRYCFCHCPLFSLAL